MASLTKNPKLKQKFLKMGTEPELPRLWGPLTAEEQAEIEQMIKEANQLEEKMMSLKLRWGRLYRIFWLFYLAMPKQKRKDKKKN